MRSSIATTPWYRASSWSRQRSISHLICWPTSPTSSSIRGCAANEHGRHRCQRKAALGEREGRNAPSPRTATAFPSQKRGFWPGHCRVFVALAVFAPLLSPYDPTAQNWSLVRNEPSIAHWFGTDDLGR